MASNIVFCGAPYTGKTFMMNQLASQGYNTFDIGTHIRTFYADTYAKNEVNDARIISKILEKEILYKTPWAINKVIEKNLTDFLAKWDPIFYIIRYGGPFPFVPRNRKENIENRCRHYFNTVSFLEDYIIQNYQYKIFYRDSKGHYECKY